MKSNSSTPVLAEKPIASAFSAITNDFILGLGDSLRLFQIISAIYGNYRLVRLVKSAIKYIFLFSLVMYFIPSLSCIFTLIYNFFQILSILDILNTLSSIHIKNCKKNPWDNASEALTMTIYIYFIYFITFMVDYILCTHFYYTSIVIKTFLLCMYHSFLAFNNLWHADGKTTIAKRLDHLEGLWPYYIGYGLIATVLYCYQSNVVIFFVYNCYNILMMINVFYLNKKHPKNIYFRLNFKPINNILAVFFSIF